MNDERNQDERTVEKKSPVSEEAKEQRRAGVESADQGEGESGGTAGQPRQGSGRNEGHGPAPIRRTGYDDESAPSEQGDGDPSPETLKQRDSLQGHAAESGGTGSKGSHGSRGEDEATTEGGAA